MTDRKPLPGWKLIKQYGPDAVVVGIDEVGRGAWAGPVVAGAVILPFGRRIVGLNDSKLVPHERRIKLDRRIRQVAVAVGIGWVSCDEIDAHGLTWAVRQSGLRALAELACNYDAVVLDGNHNYLADDPRASVIIKADSLIIPVSAGSIVAKVARDQYMMGLDKEYEHYGFGKHKGYGTALHRRALADHGITIHHRRSYAPLRGLA